MVTVKISGNTFEINNCTGFSDNAVKQAFLQKVNDYGGGAEYYAKEQGTTFSALTSPAKGEKFKFLSR